MAFTTTDLDSLNRAIAGGVMEATIGGNTVKYQRIDHMLAARQVIIADLRAQGLVAARDNVSVANVSRDY